MRMTWSDLLLQPGTMQKFIILVQPNNQLVQLNIVGQSRSHFPSALLASYLFCIVLLLFISVFLFVYCIVLHYCICVVVYTQLSTSHPCSWLLLYRRMAMPNVQEFKLIIKSVKLLLLRDLMPMSPILKFPIKYMPFNTQ